jgi:hypothetical protein
MGAVVADGSAYRSWDDGDHWNPMPGLSPGVEHLIYSTNYAEDGILFAVQNGVLLRSSDRAGNWSEVLSANGCPLDIALSPTFPIDGIATASRCDHLVRSTDAGSSWSEVPREGKDLEVGHLMNLRITQDRVLAQGQTQGMPLFSLDGGRNWERAYDPEQAPFLLGNLWHPILVAPDGSYLAAGRASQYASEQTVWRSQDHGRNWYAIVDAARLAGMALADSGEIWLGTSDGIFHSEGGGWLFLHPGGSLPELANTASQVVAVERQAVSKYSSHLRLYEKSDSLWRLAAQVLTTEAPRSAFPAPNYYDEPLVLLLGQDYGGLIWVMALRPRSDTPLNRIEAIPAGRGDSIDRYVVTYAKDYPSSGRITIRHGESGALYISEDRADNWNRPDPAEPGACERNPVSGFGALWFANDTVRRQLLCPLEDEQPYQGIVQSFEHGELLRLDPLTTTTYRQILALIPDWEGAAAWGTLPHYASTATQPNPPESLWPPDPLLLTAWNEGYCCRPRPVPVAELVGWGLDEAKGLDIAMQNFEGGIMIWRSDRDEILVLVQEDTRDSFTVFPD